MSSSQVDESVVVKSIIIERRVEDAFRLWTEQINDWWPRSHSISKDPQTRIILEGKVGGRFFERTAQGIEHDWGSVIAWQPPAILAYMWYLGSGQQLPTRVDVNFIKLGENRTRVDVVHRGPELIGELWGTNQSRYNQAWESVLPEFVSFCERYTR